METRKDLRQRIAELEEENEELMDVIENIKLLTQDAIEPDEDLESDEDEE